MDLLLYLALALLASAYAALLQRIQRLYDPDFTWLTVVVGVGFTLAGVALRLVVGGLPPLSGKALAWWVVGRYAGAFLASGLPIIGWQLWQLRRRLADIIRYLGEEHGQPDTEAVAEERGGRPTPNP
ncbi:hypothetical protein F8S13_22270 [Chloroflexia bacterium SDU3-3]|nr:hypothetical protein F8S13_22270 [Chloroflexia bacterium SDU3-3]